MGMHCIVQFNSNNKYVLCVLRNISRDIRIPSKWAHIATKYHKPQKTVNYGRNTTFSVATFFSALLLRHSIGIWNAICFMVFYMLYLGIYE